ncbi:MAG TPA: hypothetical protein VIG25_23050 [Pyrinomonadaceae bacterium]|jgi:Tfp pilus assembly protein PilV
METAKLQYRQPNVCDAECAGFTIMETCIAMLIMFVAVLGSVSLFAYSIQNNSGATDREMAMAVAQKQVEQFRNVRFTDSTLNETPIDGVRTTLIRAGRSYDILTKIVHSNVVNGAPSVKTLTVTVTALGTSRGSVTLRAVRITDTLGPNR